MTFKERFILGADEVEPDPASDTVVDELAGDFTDVPDHLVVRIG